MAGMLPTHLVLDSENKVSGPSISEVYNENTKLHPLTMYAVLPPADFTEPELKAMAMGHKQYLNAKKIKLPLAKAEVQNTRTFTDVIESRKSVRDFGNEPLGINELSVILWQSYGVTGKYKEPIVGERLRRAVPSAGGLYPSEIYLGIRNVTDVDMGVYHYNVPNHELELLIPGDPTEQISTICCDQPYTKEASVIILISSVFERAKRKYGERGYRYALLDLGHIGQNIYLACTALELAVMTTCGFFDDVGNEMLRLDGVDESLMYVAFVGKQKFTPDSIT